MTQPREKSEFGQEEDIYRIKSARAKYCGLGLDISGGLLKALPPVAITNLAVILFGHQEYKNAPSDTRVQHSNILYAGYIWAWEPE
jgi:hypothetical protein